MIPDKRKEYVVRDVQRGKLRGFSLSFSLTGPESVSGSYFDSPFVQSVP